MGELAESLNDLMRLRGWAPTPPRKAKPSPSTEDQLAFFGGPMFRGVDRIERSQFDPRLQERIRHAEAWRRDNPPRSRPWAYVDETWPIVLLGRRDEMADTYVLLAQLYLPGSREVRNLQTQIDRRMIELESTADHLNAVIRHTIVSLLVDGVGDLSTRVLASLGPVVLRH